jgi:hypothetical protein
MAASPPQFALYYRISSAIGISAKIAVPAIKFPSSPDIAAAGL